MLELPLTLHDGFGPFGYQYLALDGRYSQDDSTRIPWNNMYATLKNIPADWTDVVESNMVLDFKQYVYQHYFLGNVDEDMYLSLQKSWKWKPDTTLLSRTPIKCEINVIRGRDATGKIAVMIDANNNLDFSDDTPFYPETGTQKSVEFYKSTHVASYETYRKGKVIPLQIPIVIQKVADAPVGQDFWYCFPQYAKATLPGKENDYILAVRRSFSSTDYEVPEIVVMKDLKEGQKIRIFQGIQQNEILSVAGVNYRHKGVDRIKNVLLLEPVINDSKETYSLQTGYKFRPFTAKDFRTDKQIAIGNYKGKYVFLDFWGTWCKPCVESIPELEKLYKNVNTEKLEFISIAGHQNPELLSRFLKTHDMPWPQILSDSTNRLIETYNIDGFPFIILIGPDGKIVSRHLRGEKLESKLKELKLPKI